MSNPTIEQPPLDPPNEDPTTVEDPDGNPQRTPAGE
jgi:hypothetical protein